jgi:hypothetical protein
LALTIPIIWDNQNNLSKCTRHAAAFWAFYQNLFLAINANGAALDLWLKVSGRKKAALPLPLP